MSDYKAAYDPTVFIVIDSSAVAFDETGEIIETTTWNAVGQPIWEEATVCDHRGAGGEEGFQSLHDALSAATNNAELIGLDVKPVTYDA